MKRLAELFSASTGAAIVMVLSLSIAHPALGDTMPKFVYVANSGTMTSGSVATLNVGSVSAYSINGTTGALTPLAGSPFAAGSNPSSVAVDPSNKFVYVANRGSNNVSAYTVNSATGALSQVTGSPFASGTGPSTVAVDPLGKFVYVANQLSNDISAYTIDSETGALTSINGSPFAAGDSPISLTMDPLGRFLYVSDYDMNAPDYNFLGFTIDSTTGALTEIPPGDIAGGPGRGPLGAAINPAGNFLFGISRFEEDWGVNISDINGGTGGLTYVSGNGLDFTSALAVHPSGQFLYVTDDDSDYITAYTIDSTTGDLTIIPGSPYGDECAHVTTCYPMGLYTGPYATGSLPESIAIDPSGKFAYVGNKSSNNISAYTIDGSTGVLAAVAGSPFAAGMGPASVAIASSSTVPFKTFLVKAEIDEDRKTSFHVEGFFTLGKGTDGIYPLSEAVTLQVASYSVTVPTGSFKEREKFEYIFEGEINGVDVKIRIYHIIGNDYIFTAEGKGDILSGVTNPVTVGLAIGDDEGSTTVKADIDH